MPLNDVSQAPKTAPHWKQTAPLPKPIVMDRALWLLLWLRLRGWVRRLGRSVATLKGALLAIFGMMVFLPSIIAFFLTPRRAYGEMVDVNTIERYGKLGLLGLLALNVITSAGDRAVAFTPVEVNFLFAGPFSRRQLLVYKIVASLFLSIISALFMMLFFRMWTPHFLSGFVALMLAIMFVQLVAMAFVLITSTLEEYARTRFRKFVLLGLVVVLLLALLPMIQRVPELSWGAVLEQLEQSPVARVIMEPLNWFVRAFTAPQLYPDFFQYGAGCLLLDLALLTIVLGLDAFYLETAAAAGEKAYAQLQRLRTSGNAWMVWGSARKARFSIRDWPWLGGIGPIAWRQMVTALRSLKGLLLTLIPIGVLMLMPMFLATAAARARPDAPPIGPILVLAVTFFGTLPQLGFDFRGDLDRMDVLKTLPITPWRLAVGQLLTPVILVSLLQLILLVILELVGGRHLWVLGVGLLFVIPVNFLAFASENLTFLWFPIRTAAAAPGEFFQFMGRAMLLYALKMLILTMFGLAVFMVGFLAFSLAGQSWGAALGAAWLTITGGCIAFIPALAHAFHRFDVARDTPA